MGCAGGSDKPGAQTTTISKVDGITCENLTREMIQMNHKTEAEVIDQLIIQTSQNSAFDQNVASRCLDQSLTINCNNLECLIAQKENNK